MTDARQSAARATPVPAGWAYAPAPESRDIVSLQERYGLFIGGEWVEPRSGEYFTTISPRDEEPLAEVAQAGAGGRRRSPSQAARAAFETAGRSCPAASARSTSSGSRGSSRSGRASSPCSSRWTAASRSRSRATSTCRSRRRTSSTTRAGPTSSSTRSRTARPRPLGRRRPDHPLELPAADAGLEARARARGRQHRRAQAGRDDAAHGARSSATSSAQAELPPGVVNIVTGDGQHRRGARRRPSVDKIAFTGSTEVGKAIQRRLAGTGKKLTLELGGQGGEHRLRRRAARPGRRGDRQRHLLQPGPRLLRRLAPPRPGVDRRAGGRRS